MCFQLIKNVCMVIPVLLSSSHGGLVPLVGHQDIVDSPQLDIDLEAEVGEGLGGRLHHVLHLDTLSGHS